MRLVWELEGLIQNFVQLFWHLLGIPKIRIQLRCLWWSHWRSKIPSWSSRWRRSERLIFPPRTRRHNQNRPLHRWRSQRIQRNSFQIWTRRSSSRGRAQNHSSCTDRFGRLFEALTQELERLPTMSYICHTYHLMYIRVYLLVSFFSAVKNSTSTLYSLICMYVFKCSIIMKLKKESHTFVHSMRS